MSKPMKYPKPSDFAPEPTWPKGHAWHGQAGRCQAWNATRGRQCTKRSTKLLDVCTKDGGKSAKGSAHYNYQGKGRSKYMPEGLLETFDRMMADPELLSLNADIATHEALIEQALSELGGVGEALTVLGELGQHWELLWLATRREDKEGMARHRKHIDELAGRGASMAAARDTFLALTELKRKLVESEARRRERMQSLVAIEDAGMMFQLLAKVVTKHVTDRGTMAKIAEEWAGITGRIGVQRAVTSDD